MAFKKYAGSLFQPSSNVNISGNLNVTGQVLTSTGNGTGWQPLVDQDDIKGIKDVTTLLLRERNGDKAASAILDHLSEDLIIPQAAFSEIVRIVEEHVPAYNYSLDCEMFVATVQIRHGQFKITVKGGAIMLQPVSSRGAVSEKVRHRTLMLADPKVFEKVEAFVKAI